MEPTHAVGVSLLLGPPLALFLHGAHGSPGHWGRSVSLAVSLATLLASLLVLWPTAPGVAVVTVAALAALLSTRRGVGSLAGGFATAAIVACVATVAGSGVDSWHAQTVSMAGGVSSPTRPLLTLALAGMAVHVPALWHGVLLECPPVSRNARRVLLLGAWLSAAGFLVAAFAPVGGTRGLSVAHNLASVAALGAACLKMPFVPRLLPAPRTRFRVASAALPVLAFALWLPTGLRFLGLIGHSPVTTFAMESCVVLAVLAWLVLLAAESGRPAALTPATASPYTACDE